MSNRVTEQPMFENCRIIFRNFAGEQSQYNPKGNRNFCVVIDDHDVAKKMLLDGWNVKYLPAREEGDEETPYIQVTVSFDNVPPTIVLISSKGRTLIDESSVNILDYAEIENLDLIVNPYNWSVNGKSGVKAYLKSMYVTMREDALALKYADIQPVDDEIPF